ncbi:MAG TPA: hypothetical protein EYP29_03505 [Thermoplasmata archaeon]|nr:hypothetical protein [Thermoplasmata archaeon]
MKCKQDENRKLCNCTYSGCPRHGICCQCLKYHLSRRELPACVFPDEVERTWDRSFEKFIETYS